MNASCSVCGSYAVNIDPAEKLCDAHFYKVQRDELLEAARWCVALCEETGATETNAYAQASAAIAKAEGGAA